MKEFHGEYKGEALVTVNSTNTAAAVGSGSLPVYATPMMLALMEEARQFHRFLMTGKPQSAQRLILRTIKQVQWELPYLLWPSLKKLTAGDLFFQSVLRIMTAM